MDGLRCLAALHIYVFHLNQHVHTACCSYECSLCKFGKYWVQVFFLLSGFVSAVANYRRESAIGPSLPRTPVRRLPIF